jgi:hypothetical protein
MNKFPDIDPARRSKLWIDLDVEVIAEVRILARQPSGIRGAFIRLGRSTRAPPIRPGTRSLEPIPITHLLFSDRFYLVKSPQLTFPISCRLVTRTVWRSLPKILRPAAAYPGISDDELLTLGAL